MRIQFILPNWSMDRPWVGALRKALVNDQLSFLDAPTTEADVHVFMWCVNVTPLWDIPCVVYIRRYEFFSGDWKGVDWERVGHVVFVNTVLMLAMSMEVPGLIGKSSVIYNCYDPDRWTYKDRGHGKKIAMVGHVNFVKNIPMALQILSHLPEHELHIAGEVRQYEIPAYARARGDRVQFHGHVRDIDRWLEDKNYLLHCSVSEGNPNCVIEAMAKGIKPIIHNFPGSAEQFPSPYIFKSNEEAVALLSQDSGYFSQDYLALANDTFSMSNLIDLRNIITNVTETVTA